jgi:hypothetical protein
MVTRTTVAGTGLRVNGVAVDTAGNIYIVDYRNNRVRMVGRFN